MNIKHHRSGLLCLLLLALFLLTGASHGQETRKQLEDRISELRAEEQDLENFRAELQDDLRKIATTDESGRSQYVVMTGAGFGGTFWLLVPRERYERLAAIGILTGEVTPQRVAQNIRETIGKTRAFPEAARARLRETEQQIARIKTELPALEARLARLKGNAPSRGNTPSNTQRAETYGRGSQPPAARTGSSSQFTVNHNTKRSSFHWREIELPRPNYGLCQNECAKDPECLAYTFIKPGFEAQQCVLLYKKIGGPEKCNYCISGVKKQPS